MLVAPVINQISSEMFSVEGHDLSHRGVFKLDDLAFNWGPLPRHKQDNRKPHEPIEYGISRTSMARTPLEPLKFARDRGSSS